MSTHNAHMRVCMCVFVVSCLTTEDFVGTLPAIQRGGSSLSSPMMKRGQPQLSDRNWGARDAWSSAPQLRSDNY